MKKSSKKELKILEAGDPLFPQTTKKLSIKEIKSIKIQKFINDFLLAVQKDALVGLAAPQTGLDKRIIVVHIHPTKYRPDLKDEGATVIINPVILKQTKTPKIVMGWEGCGSLPGIFARVPRPQSVKLSYLDRQGVFHTETFTDFKARIIYHECDHLGGIMFLERADLKSIVTSEQYKRIMGNTK